jgi:hypothetical protein
LQRTEELREMKDVRNMIAHDYAGARAAEIFAWCREQKPVFGFSAVFSGIRGDVCGGIIGFPVPTGLKLSAHGLRGTSYPG